MILTFEDLRKEALALQMFHQPGFRVLLVELERDNAVRSEFPGKLSLHDNGIAAERAGRRGSRIVPDNFSAAGLAHVRFKTCRLSVAPFAADSRIPRLSVSSSFFSSIIIEILIKILIQFLQLRHLVYAVAVRTLHLLQLAVKG